MTIRIVISLLTTSFLTATGNVVNFFHISVNDTTVVIIVIVPNFGPK